MSVFENRYDRSDHDRSGLAGSDLARSGSDRPSDEAPKRRGGSLGHETAEALQSGEEKLVFRHAAYNWAKSDDFESVEFHLKTVWSSYVERQEKFGFDEKARELRDEYFKLYRQYRRNKTWKQIVSNEQ